jgi:hypothetical protein
MAAAKFDLCRACPVGAAHAGESVTYFSPLYGKSICCRCGRGSMRRLILNRRLCVSCFNRQNEFVRGRNAKGNTPTIKLDRRTVRYTIEGGEFQTLTLEHSADMAELMVAVLRKTRGRVSFAFRGQGPVGMAAAS